MVSVCLATFNGASYISEQVHSILSQLQADDELVISDDGSTDNTVSIINQIGDDRIKVYPGNKFSDPIKNFQHALSKASGDIIFLSDQDDVWLKDKYQTFLALLKDTDLVVSDAVVTDEKLNTINPSFFQLMHAGPGILKNIFKSTYYGSCMAFNKKILKYAIPFPPTKEIGHDLWLGLVAEIVGKTYFCSTPLIFYRRHDRAFTVTGIGKSNRSIYQKTKGRLIMIFYIAKFFAKYKLKLL
jgi:glycosyltransferase involved in cell wall biosynthesis